MKIYTKTGDNGSTSLIGGSRVAKDDLSIETFGTLDELNAHLGLLRPMLHHQYDKAFVTHIQSLLFVIGSYLASDPAQPDKRQRYLLPAAEVQGIEKEIDKIEKQLPPQTAFVLPGLRSCAEPFGFTPLVLLCCLVDAVVQRKPMYAERFVDEPSDV